MCSRVHALLRERINISRASLFLLHVCIAFGGGEGDTALSV